MTRKDISDGVGNISTRHIQEAASYMAAEKKVSFFKKPFGRSMIAAVLALCILAGGISIFSPFGGMVVTAYAHGTDEEITQAGAVINTGTISDSGEMTGHPLMFYLSGKDISTVRFSCKNQQINFMDWTEKRATFRIVRPVNGQFFGIQFFKLAGGEQHFMLFADGKSTRDSRISGARECSSLDGTK